MSDEDNNYGDVSPHDIDYPVEYRGNLIYDEGKVKDLSPENKPNLSMVQGQFEVNQVLDHIGVDYDNESVIAEDSYGCLWIDTCGGDYCEVWGMHMSVPYLNRDVVRLL